uniref:MADF domain-containing protein n=1 Tax=Glossina pallidipes TaxID=7398 RepID=A0A1A9Z4F6_GLOPL
MTNCHARRVAGPRASAPACNRAKVYKTMKRLRDKFSTEVRLSKGSRWQYFKQMQFLMEHLAQQRQQSAQQQHAVIDLTDFNDTTVPGAAQAWHPHVEITAKVERERLDDDQHNENMLNPIKIFQNTT